MKQTILVSLLFASIIAGLFYLGGYALFVGLGAIILTGIILLSFLAGVKIAHRLMSEGAKLAIETANNNDQHDASKIKALSELTREAIKAKNEGYQNNYPALPPLAAIDGSFSIAGLDDERIE